MELYQMYKKPNPKAYPHTIRHAAHAVISMTESCLFFLQCYLKARRSRASNADFWLFLLPTEISPNRIFLKALCAVDDEVSHWGTIFWNSSIMLHQIGNLSSVYSTSCPMVAAIGSSPPATLSISRREGIDVPQCVGVVCDPTFELFWDVSLPLNSK